MRCEEVQEYLADHLAGSLSDRLSGTVHSYVRAHMLSCPECCEEMEHFEEIQKVLRSIPVEPCDSNAMRARFDLLMGATETKAPAALPLPLRARIRPLKVVLVSLAAIVVITAAVLTVRQAANWISVTRVAPQVPHLPPNPSRPQFEPAPCRVRFEPRMGKCRERSVWPLSQFRSPECLRRKSPWRAVRDGKYRLENIPTGQYYVLASSVDAAHVLSGLAGCRRCDDRFDPGRSGPGRHRFPSHRICRKTNTARSSSEMAELSGRVLLEDGSEVSDSLSLGEIAMNATGNSTSTSTTTVNLDANGRFSRFISPR